MKEKFYARKFFSIISGALISAYAMSASALTLEAPPPEKHPVLIVPGTLESNNFNRIFYDKGGGTWGFTPSVKPMFDPLVTRLKNEGYEEGKDLFIAHYDWRENNADVAQEYLKPAIDHAKNVSHATQVNIVAHSMGGLVARSYIQGDNYDDDVLNLIMLGTPNAGASSAYDIWEGGIFPSTWDIGQKLWITRIERALIKVRKTSSDRPFTYRTFFPSVRQLLPTYQFVERDGQALQPSDLKEQNSFLENLNTNATLMDERGVAVTTIAGTGMQTQNNIPITYTRTADDLAKNRWRDGHADPDPPVTNSTDGDGTVLVSSANAVGSLNITIPNAKHTELQAKGQDEVIEALKGEPGTADYVHAHYARAQIGVDVFSPVMPVIHGPNGEILSSTQNTFPNAVFNWDPDIPDHVKMLTIIDPPAGDYTVELIGTDSGPFTLDISHASDSTDITEKEYTGTAVVGSKSNYTFSVGDGGQSITITTPDDPSNLDGGSSSNTSKEEHDCCPGKDPVQTKKKIGRVLGASSKKHKPVTLEELKPLNDTFFSVYGRMPTFEEWQYWAHRYEFDKRDWKKLYGAMCWHFARGLV